MEKGQNTGYIKNMAYTYAFVLNIWLLVGVFGFQMNETVTVSVMEGDSVTLHTGRSEIHTDDHVLWMSSSHICIAQVKKQIISFPDGDKSFRNRLLLDNKTGSLTITNVTNAHKGLYELIISRNRTVFNEIFLVNVYGRELYLAVPVIITARPSSPSSSVCSLLCSVANVSHVTLSWFKGHSLISSTSVSDVNNSISLPLDIDCLDDSYRCVLNNPINTRTQHLNSTELCPPCPERVQCCGFIEAVIRLAISAVVGVAAVVIVVYDIRSRRNEDDENIF